MLSTTTALALTAEGNVDGEIYLDNNATTRPSPEVRQAVVDSLGEGFGNPSSGHARGQRARNTPCRTDSPIAALAGFQLWRRMGARTC